MNKTVDNNITLDAHQETIEEQMLDALELFQYSFNFRDQLFVICLANSDRLESLLTDFKVIQASQIFLLVVVAHTEKTFSKVIDAKRNGLLIEYIRHDPYESYSRDKLKTIRSEYASHDIVVVGLDRNNKKITPNELIQESLEISGLCNAKKYFYSSPEGELHIDEKAFYHANFEYVKKAIDSDLALKPKKEILQTIIHSTPNNKLEIVLIDDTPGSLFQEIFTHQGRGTLITDEYPNTIRWGEPRDLFAVSRLMKPHIERGILLPVSDEDLKKEIHHFLLYTINDAIVAGARMYHYETKDKNKGAVELAKFFCLPRYRRRGHARSLAQNFINQAKEMGKEYVFSLSVSEGMWEFLKSLDFEEVDRSELPEEWKNTYDFNRPSKAFRLLLV